MNNMSCNVIRDLFPSYVDQLTSEESNKLVEEHVAECQECARILRDMQEGSKQDYKPTEKEKKEIDFLKKNKKRNFRIGIYCAVGAILCVLLVLFIRAFGMGMERLSSENWNVEKITVENGEIHLKVKALEGSSYVSQIFVDEGNVAGENTVVITPKIVFMNPFHSEEKEFTYQLTYPEKAKTIYFGTQVIYADGEAITQKTSDLYGTRHLYVGSMPSNGSTANALRLSDLFGSYDNELETAEEPYGWIIKIKDNVSERERVMREGYMDSTACVLIALIQNLDHVTFQYSINGEATSKTITAADASQIIGQDVKNCYDNPKIFQDLLVRLGWN